MRMIREKMERVARWMAFLSVVTALLMGRNDLGWARGFITIEAKDEAKWPQVFIVDAKGESFLVDSTEGKDVPDGSKIEIRDAQPDDTIRVAGEVRIEVLGGAAQLYLLGDLELGDPQVVVSNEAGETKIQSLAGSPTVTIGEETKLLSPGQSMEISNTNNQLNVVVHEAPERGATEAAAVEGVKDEKPSFALSPEEVSLLKSLSVLKPETASKPVPSSLPSTTKLLKQKTEDPFASLEAKLIKTKIEGTKSKKKDKDSSTSDEETGKELEVFLKDLEDQSDVSTSK